VHRLPERGDARDQRGEELHRVQRAASR
jgi:hypothetical protein